MSRNGVVSLLSGDGVLLSLGLVDDRIYGSNAIDTPREYPFLVVTFEDTTPAFGDRGTRGLTVWAYDEPSDYTRLDAMITRIRSILTSATHFKGSDGWTITQIDWAGSSPDLYDDGWHAISRNAGFRVVSRQG